MVILSRFIVWERKSMLGILRLYTGIAPEREYGDLNECNYILYEHRRRTPP
jgi:hypothetical protein